MSKPSIIIVLAAAGAAAPAAAQTFGPDYSQRSLPGGSDTIGGGTDLTASDKRPVGCIYQYSHRIPRPDVAALVKNGFAPKTSGEKMAMQVLGETVAACRTGQGWGPKRQDASLRYFQGRILMDDALYQGRAYGLTGTIVQKLAGKLDPATRAAFDSGKVEGAQIGAAYAQLKAAGLDTDTLSPEKAQALAPLVAQALWGLHLQTAGAEAFAIG